MDSQNFTCPVHQPSLSLAPWGQKLLSQKLPLSYTHPTPDLCNTPVGVSVCWGRGCLLDEGQFHPPRTQLLPASI